MVHPSISYDFSFFSGVCSICLLVTISNVLSLQRKWGQVLQSSRNVHLCKILKLFKSLKILVGHLFYTLKENSSAGEAACCTMSPIHNALNRVIMATEQILITPSTFLRFTRLISLSNPKKRELYMARLGLPCAE